MDNNKELMRTLIAIDFPSEVLGEITRIQEIIGKNIKFNGKVTESENLHLTLKFLGEIEPKKVEEVKKKLEEIKIKKFEARLADIGSFSVRGKPRIVWVKVEGEGIWKLQSLIDNLMREIGFKEEERFMSHVTLARVKYVKDKIKFIDYIKCLKAKGLKFSVDGFKLVKSELRKTGPVYSVIQEYKFEESNSL